MKRYIKLIIVVICIFQLVGCSNKNVENTSNVDIPKNNLLIIRGNWSIDGYKVIDNKIYNEEHLKAVKDNNIIIKNSELDIGGKKFADVRYKLKVVDKSYNIAYEEKYTVDNLKIDKDKVEVISIIYQNSILGEFIVVDEEQGYLFYQGILFNLVLNNEVYEENSNENEKASLESNYESDNKGNNSEGLYLGIKTTVSQEEEEEYIGEEYRTLWISTKNNELQEVREKDNIIFPRLNGIWTLEENIINDKNQNIYYEYFTAKPMDVKVETNQKVIPMLVKEDLYRSINFIGNDYVSTEVRTKENGIYNDRYEVLPVDNLLLDKGLLISDIYTKEINRTYESIYEQVYKSLSIEEKSMLSKYISYTNFSVVRNNGKWILQGRISPIGDGVPYDFNTSIKPNKNLMNYNTLIIPWKTLKRDIPLIEDAFTSPNGKIAIIVMKSELLIYAINEGDLVGSPMKRIPLKEGDEIIMAEWCSADYVDKWGSIFKDNSRIIE